LLARAFSQVKGGEALGVELRYPTTQRARLRIWDRASNPRARELGPITQSAREQRVLEGHGRSLPDLELAATADILRLHGAELQVLSEPGAGSTCLIYLPVQRRSTTVVRRPPEQPVRALVVSPQDAARETLRGALASAGFDPRLMASGKEALSANREHCHRLCFVDEALTDLEAGRLCAGLAAERPEEPLAICVLTREERAPRAGEGWVLPAGKVGEAGAVISAMTKSIAADARG
jgi:hypothetical protein